MQALEMLRTLARCSGDSWAAVCKDGELLCMRCVRGNYRQIYAASVNRDDAQWAIVGLTNRGEKSAACAHCATILWEPVNNGEYR